MWLMMWAWVCLEQDPIVEVLELHATAIHLEQEQSIKFDKGAVTLGPGNLAQVTVTWQGVPHVVGYIPGKGVKVRASLHTDDPSEQRVLKHNIDQIEKIKANTYFATTASPVGISDVIFDKSGLVFFSGKVPGTELPIPADLKQTAEKTIHQYNEARHRVYYHWLPTLDPVLGTLFAVVNKQPFLLIDYLAYPNESFDPWLVYFADKARHFNQGFAVFDRKVGAYAIESVTELNLVQDYHLPAFHPVQAQQLRARVEGSGDQLDFAVDLTVKDLTGGHRLLYFDLMSERWPLRVVEAETGLEGLDTGALSITRNRREDAIWVSSKIVLQPLGNKDDAITVSRVANGSGESLDFLQGYQCLLVDMGKVSAKDETLSLSFAYGGAAMARDFGDNLVHFGAHDWWPKPGRSAANRVSTHIEIALDKNGWIPVAPGTLREIQQRDGKEWRVFEETRQIPEPNLFLGDLRPVEERIGDHLFRYYAYSQEKKKTARRIHKVLTPYVKFFEGIWGPLPYDEVQVIEMPGFTAYQTPGLILLNSLYFQRMSSSFDDESADSNQIRGLNEELAVQVAGLWWSGLVQPGSIYDQWVKTAFSEYGAYMMLKDAAHYKRADDAFLHRWQARQKYVADLPLAQAFNLVDNRNEDVVRDVMERKGAWVIHEIRTKLNDDNAFVTFMNRYLLGINFRSPNSVHLMENLNGVTGKDFRALFEKEIWGQNP